MLNPSSNTKAFICSEPVDMRSSFDSLSGIVQQHFGQSPLSGNLFVFFSVSVRSFCLEPKSIWWFDGTMLSGGGYYKRVVRALTGSNAINVASERTRRTTHGEKQDKRKQEDSNSEAMERKRSVAD